MLMRRPVFRYQGAKYAIADWVISFFPKHKIYCECFAGTAAILLNKPRSVTEIYNDLNSNLVDIFKCLRNSEQAKELKKRLELTPWSRQEYYEAHEANESDDEVEKVRKLLIRAYMGMGAGSINRGKGGFQTMINHKDYKCNQARAFLTYFDCIPEFTARLQGVVIENRKAEKVIQIYDTDKTLHYVDPPYMLDTWRKQDKVYGKLEYSNEQHEKLITLLKSVKGFVVLSGYKSDLYMDMLKDWHIEKRETFNQQRDKRIECLWISLGHGML